MKRKIKLLGILALSLIALAFTACGDDGDPTSPPPNGTTFTASVNDTVANDAATLGLIGTSVSSSNAAVATAAIAEGKIRITSVSQGTAIITVSGAEGNAIINITVSATGAITIGSIGRYINTEPKSIQLTDFTDAHTGEWQIWLVNSTSITAISEIVALVHAAPSDGNISGAFLILGDEGPTDAWTGSGDYYIFLIPRQPNDHPDVNRYLSKTKVSFTSAQTIYSFTDNFIVEDITVVTKTMAGIWTKTIGAQTALLTVNANNTWSMSSDGVPYTTGIWDDDVISMWYDIISDTWPEPGWITAPYTLSPDGDSFSFVGDEGDLAVFGGSGPWTRVQ